MTDLGVVARLEDVGDRTWPALEGLDRNGWRLRFAAGVTRRSNSATWRGPSAAGDDAGDVAPAAVRAGVEFAESWLASRLDALTFRLTPLAPAGLDDLLASRGYRRNLGAHTMTAPVRSFGHSEGSWVTLLDDPDDGWWRVLSATGADRNNPAVMASLFEEVRGRSVYAKRMVGDGIVAIGMAVRTQEYVSVFNMNTLQGVRRAGHGIAILRSLVGWGGDHGAAEAFLQVHPANTDAVALYHDMGFVTRYDYHYWEKPAPGSLAS